MTITDYFPAPSYRKYQKEVLLDIEKAFAHGKNTVLLQAPTGFGKSPLNIAFCRAFASAFYTTPQLLLVEQIAGDPMLKEHVAVIKGRENYPCNFYCKKCKRAKECVDTVNKKLRFFGKECSLSCANAPCYRKKNFECEFWKKRGEEYIGECIYKNVKRQALRSHTALMTTAYFFAEGQYAKQFGNRDLLIVDECQNLEGWLQKQVEVVVPAVSIVCDTFEDAFTIAKRKREEAIKVVEEFEEIMGERELTMKEFDELERNRKFVLRMNNFLDDIDEGYEWVFLQIPYTRFEGFKIVFKPVTVERFGKRIWRRADKYILSSATIIDDRMFTRCVGLDTEYTLIDVPSTFPVEHRTITFARAGRMVHNNPKLEEVKRKALERIEQIMDIHKDVRGIIHFPSYDHSKFVYNNIDDGYKGRFVFHDTDDRSEQYEEWIKNGKSNSVFLGVAMYEGLDLKDDLARFQILYKAPFPDLKDPYVVARKSLDDGQDWYVLKALTAIVQSYGRAVRSEEDWAHFYILDTAALHLLGQHQKLLPNWFKDAMRWMKWLKKSG